MPSAPVKSAEHMFKNILNLPVRLFIRRGYPNKMPVNPQKIKSILFLRQDKLGDMLVSIPAMHTIKKLYPHVKVEVLASPRNVMVVENDPLIDEVHLYTKVVSKDLKTVRKLKRKRFNIIYDTIINDSTTGLILTNIISRKAVRVASRKNKHRKYYDFCEEYNSDGTDHNIDNAFLLFNIFGVDPSTLDHLDPLYLPDKSTEIANRFIDNLPEPESNKVAINISAGRPARTMDIDKFIDTAFLIKKEYPDSSIIIFCVMSDRDKAVSIKNKLNGNIEIIPENLSFLDACAILSRMNYLISPDTSMVHAARLFKIPTVGLYSNYDRNYYSWKPYGQKYGGVRSDNIYNIHDITPGDILNEFQKLKNEIESAMADK